MKNVSTGFGLCVAAAAALAYPFVSSLAPNANAVGIGTPAATAMGAAATAQGAPTIVWYGIAAYGYWGSGQPIQDWTVVGRAWSDGRLEIRRTRFVFNSCGTQPQCEEPWVVVNNPSQGLTFDADLNFDEAVDGVDLGMMLAKWGPAPRNPVPPSDCPLALINP